ncbi:hypothetical protein GGR57DRAFT_322873 [Xylariaceae sp. FL1272]|nr:hypothetical protein GGR57DRAFT_322873 [Xylariaceae sp. FL1272]
MSWSLCAVELFFSTVRSVCHCRSDSRCRRHAESTLATALSLPLSPDLFRFESTIQNPGQSSNVRRHQVNYKLRDSYTCACLRLENKANLPLV